MMGTGLPDYSEYLTFTGDVIELLDYSNHLNTGLVRYSNGPNVSGS